MRLEAIKASEANEAGLALIPRKEFKTMLVLARKPGQKLFIGNEVVVTVVRVGPASVRLGIECPREMNVRREECRADRKPVLRSETEG